MAGSSGKKEDGAMLNTFFRGIFDTTQTAVIAPGEFLLCVGTALVLGLLLSCCVSFGARTSRSFTAALALLPSLVFGGVSILYNRMDFGQRRRRERDRQLHITIPEELNYSEAFTDIFAEYTDSAELQLVKTTNMGSLYRLSYQLRLKNPGREKEMLDALRCRNGNLEISISMQENGNGEL